MYLCTMFKNNKINGLFFLVILLISSACSNFNKVVKSNDSEYKYKKAIEYYESGQYSKASTLLSQIVTIYRGTSRADEIYFYYGKSLFALGDNLNAGHWFNTLIREFPKSKRGEESQFMVGYCYYMQSPKPRLDQTVTKKAIDAFQLYLNIFPMSDRLEECNSLIAELQDKLVYKTYLTGILYYDLGNYRAATIALANSLKRYPDTKYREVLAFRLLESKYNLAIFSTSDKKELRLSDALDEYYAFIDEFPNSKYKRLAERYHRDTAKLLNYDN